MSTIARIEITHHQLPLDPPFTAAWDPVPRTKFPATIVRVFDDQGRFGVGSGDAMHGFDGFARWFIGEDPLDLDRHSAVLSNIDFHAGRPWPLDVALRDLAGKIRGEPIWRLLGGREDRVRAYASTGVHRPAREMVQVARHALDAGFAALKLRMGRANIEDDFAVVSAVRDAAGDALELMVDCNQGWRMPWDVREPWDLERASAVVARLAGERLYWIEEPLHRGDWAGYAELRRRFSTRIAGGELTREPYEFAQLLSMECLDVFQPDCVLTMGIGGLRELARSVIDAGHMFTPHTWGNGIGLMANLQLVAAAGGGPFVEFPFDPPDWTAARRDFMLTRPIEMDGEGRITLPRGPGLGIELDEAALAQTLTGGTTFA